MLKEEVPPHRKTDEKPMIYTHSYVWYQDKYPRTYTHWTMTPMRNTPWGYTHHPIVSSPLPHSYEVSGGPYPVGFSPYLHPSPTVMKYPVDLILWVSYRIFTPPPTVMKYPVYLILWVSYRIFTPPLTVMKYPVYLIRCIFTKHNREDSLLQSALSIVSVLTTIYKYTLPTTMAMQITIHYYLTFF